MIIGSLDIIQKNDSMYTICNIDTYKQCSRFLLLFQSFLHTHPNINPNINPNLGVIISNNNNDNNSDNNNNRSIHHSIQKYPYLYCSRFITSLDEYILSNPFTIDTATLLLRSLYVQTQFFLENNMAISFIDLNDIMTIDGTQFYFCNVDKMYSMKKNKTITITNFYDTNNHFIPPELRDNSMMPFSTSYTSSFYSLAVIILFCLHYSHKVDTVDTVDTSIIPVSNSTILSAVTKPVDLSVYQYMLDKYQHSKLYYSLMLCLVPDPTQRKLFLM